MNETSVILAAQEITAGAEREAALIQAHARSIQPPPASVATQLAGIADRRALLVEGAVTTPVASPAAAVALARAAGAAPLLPMPQARMKRLP